MTDKKIVIKLRYGAEAQESAAEKTASKPVEYDWHYGRIVGFLVIAILIAGGLILGLPDKPGTLERQAQTNSAEVPALAETTVMEKGPAMADEVTIQPAPVVEIPAANSSEPVARSEVDISETSADAETIAPRTDFSSLEKVEDGTSDVSDKVETGDRGTLLGGTDILSRAQFSWGITSGREPTSSVSSPAILQRGDQVQLYFFTEISNMKGHSVTHEWRHRGKVLATREFRVGGDRWRVYSSKTLNSALLGEWQVSVRDQDGKVLGQYSLSVEQPAHPG